MIKIDLIKRLNSSVLSKRLEEENSISGNKALANAEKILLSQTDEDRKYLTQRLGMYSYYNNSIASTLKNIDTKYSKILEKKQYSAGQLQELCKKYDLKVLNLRCYKGDLPSNFVSIMREWESQRKPVSMNNVYIMAPIESFDTVKVSLKSLNHDPIVFYQESYSSNYELITKFGNDFTILRRIKSMFKYREPITTAIIKSSVILFCINEIYCTFAYTDMLINRLISNVDARISLQWIVKNIFSVSSAMGHTLISVFSLVFSIIFLVIILVYLSETTERIRVFANENWNTERELQN